VRIAWIHIKQKGVVIVCQGQQQILNASEEVLNTDTSRHCQLRSVVRTLLCACVVALVPYDSVFGQAPATERWEYDARIRPLIRFQRQSDFWRPRWWIPNMPLFQEQLGGRIALLTEVRIVGRPLAVYNLHLESRGDDQLRA